MLAEGDDNRLDLLSELTGGGQDEGLGLLQLAVDLLEDADGEGGGLAGTRLGLGDHITITGDGDDGTLLDGRGVLKTKI